MEKDVTNEHESQSSNGLSDDELNSQYFKEFSNFDVMQVKVNFQKSAKTTLHNSWKNIQKLFQFFLAFLTTVRPVDKFPRDPWNPKMMRNMITVVKNDNKEKLRKEESKKKAQAGKEQSESTDEQPMPSFQMNLNNSMESPLKKTPNKSSYRVLLSDDEHDESDDVTRYD